MPGSKRGFSRIPLDAPDDASERVAHLYGDALTHLVVRPFSGKDMTDAPLADSGGRSDIHFTVMVIFLDTRGGLRG